MLWYLIESTLSLSLWQPLDPPDQAGIYWGWGLTPRSRRQEMLRIESTEPLLEGIAYTMPAMKIPHWIRRYIFDIDLILALELTRKRSTILKRSQSNEVGNLIVLLGCFSVKANQRQRTWGARCRGPSNTKLQHMRTLCPGKKTSLSMKVCRAVSDQLFGNDWQILAVGPGKIISNWGADLRLKSGMNVSFNY